MKVIFQGQVPKDPSFPEAMEDALAFSVDQKKIALSDGASESFDSKTWAQLLVANFVINPEIDQGWLKSIVQQYATNYDLATLSWSKAAAYERGSFATLLGIECSTEHEDVEMICVGDSLAVFLNDDQLLNSFPYGCSEDFQKRPSLFCSNLGDNHFFSADDFYSTHQLTWRYQGLEAPSILCMTDALGEWALRHAEEGNPKWGFLREIRDRDTLSKFVIEERAARRMKIDDVTLITISLNGVAGNDLPHA